MSLRDDTRGASIPITHAMTIAITAILLASLMVGAGGFLNRQQETVAREQLAEIGGDVADLVTEADRLNASGEAVNLTVEPGYPQSVAGAPYTIELRPSTGSSNNGVLALDTRVLDRPIRIPLSTDTPIEESSARGESPTVRLCHGGGEHRIALRECPL